MDEKIDKSSITRMRIARFRPDFLQSLNMWHALYYRRSRSSIKGQGHSVKTSSDRQIIALFAKTGSLNLTAMSEFWSEAEKKVFVRSSSTNFATNSPDWRDVRRPSSCNAFAVATFSGFVFYNDSNDNVAVICQGPCALNQMALAHSRLWDAVSGFLFIFAHMQDKLSKVCTVILRFHHYLSSSTFNLS